MRNIIQQAAKNSRRGCLSALAGLAGYMIAGKTFGAPQRGRGRGRGRGFGGGGHGQGRGQGQGQGWGQGRGQNDPQFQRDRNTFQFLLQNHKKIRRNVKNLPNGVETVTESDDVQVIAALQEHVAAMHNRVATRRPIRQRDPLFAALFQNAQWTKMSVKNIEKGVHVMVTSQNAFAVRLIQAHAQVVSLFVKLGFAEARKNHAVPK